MELHWCVTCVICYSLFTLPLGVVGRLTFMIVCLPEHLSRPRWLSWMRRPTGDQEVAGSTPAEVGNIPAFVEIDHEISSTVIHSLPLIQEGQLSVSGGRMCTILVNRLEACPVNVWLGKLTALDMTPMGWLGRKTLTQTNPEHLLYYRDQTWFFMH